MDAHSQAVRTLVVDDSAAALQSICGFLNLNPDIDVIGTASDGNEGLARAHALRPDLVLVDVQMPVMNGIEAAARLRQDLPTVRIIMITAHDSPEVRQACRASGADGFIAKEHLDEELPRLLQHMFHVSEKQSVK